MKIYVTCLKWSGSVITMFLCSGQSVGTEFILHTLVWKFASHSSMASLHKWIRCTCFISYIMPISIFLLWLKTNIIGLQILILNFRDLRIIAILDRDFDVSNLPLLCVQVVMLATMIDSCFVLSLRSFSLIQLAYNTKETETATTMQMDSTIKEPVVLTSQER